MCPCQQSVTREVATENTPKKKKFNTPKKKFFSSAKSAHHMQSPGGPRAVRSTNFHEIACLPITVHALNKAHFALERVRLLYSHTQAQSAVYSCLVELYRWECTMTVSGFLNSGWDCMSISTKPLVDYRSKMTCSLVIGKIRRPIKKWSNRIVINN